MYIIIGSILRIFVQILLKYKLIKYMHWNVDIVDIYFEHPVFYLKIYKCNIQNYCTDRN